MTGETVKKLALVGLNNSHPFILSALVNGGDRAAFVRNSPGWTHSLFPDKDWPGSAGDGARFTHAWSRDPEFAVKVAEATRVPTVTASLAEAAESTEGAFVCDMWGEYHREQAMAFLSQGKPVFVDKPLSASAEDARVMIDTAREKGTVLSHCSSTRFDPSLIALRARMAEKIGRPSIITVCAPCYQDLARYAVHGIEIMSMVTGGEQVVSVRNLGSGTRRHILVLEFADGASGLIHAWEGHAYSVTVTGPKGQDVIAITSNSYLPMVKAVLESFETGVPVVPYEEALQVIRVIEAGSLSQARDGAPVHLL